jgi:hypothetical protein
MSSVVTQALLERAFREPITAWINRRFNTEPDEGSHITTSWKHTAPFYIWYVWHVDKELRFCLNLHTGLLAVDPEKDADQTLQWSIETHVKVIDDVCVMIDRFIRQTSPKRKTASKLLTKEHERLYHALKTTFWFGEPVVVATTKGVAESLLEFNGRPTWLKVSPYQQALNWESVRPIEQYMIQAANTLTPHEVEHNRELVNKLAIALGVFIRAKSIISLPLARPSLTAKPLRSYATAMYKCKTFGDLVDFLEQTKPRLFKKEKP